MPAVVRELELPLGEREVSDLARRRLRHLAQVIGVDPHGLLRLTRAFPTLAAIYAAPEAELARHIGRTNAAQFRWFLDAPLEMRAVQPPRAPDRGLLE